MARVPTRTKIEPQVSTHDSNVLPVVCVLYAFSDSWMEFYVGGGGTNTGPSQFRGTPDCNESAALHSYGLDSSLSLRVLY